MDYSSHWAILSGRMTSGPIRIHYHRDFDGMVSAAVLAVALRQTKAENDVQWSNQYSARGWKWKSTSQSQSQSQSQPDPEPTEAITGRTLPSQPGVQPRKSPITPAKFEPGLQSEFDE